MIALRVLAGRARIVRNRPAVVVGSMLARAGLLDAYAIWPSAEAPAIAFNPGDSEGARWLRGTLDRGGRAGRVDPGLRQALRSRTLLVAHDPTPAVALAERALSCRLDGARTVLVSPGGGVGKVTCFLRVGSDSAPGLVVQAMSDPQRWQRLERELAMVDAIRARVADWEEVLAALPMRPLHRGRVGDEYVVVERYDDSRASGDPPHREASMRWLGALRAATRSPARPLEERDVERAAESVAKAWRLLRPERTRAVTAAVRELMAALVGTPVYDCAVHGDFWAGNMSARDEELRVSDWEWAELAGTPVFDIWVYELCELVRLAQAGETGIDEKLRAALARVALELKAADIDPRFAPALLAPTLADLSTRVRCALGLAGPWEREVQPLLLATETILAELTATTMPPVIHGTDHRPRGGRFAMSQSSSAWRTRVRAALVRIPAAKSAYGVGYRIAVECKALFYAARIRVRLWRHPDERGRVTRQAACSQLRMTVDAAEPSALAAAATARGLAASDRGYGVYLDADAWPALMDGARTAQVPDGAAALIVPSGGSDAQARLLAGNLIHELALGPRIFDVIPVEAETATWTAFMLEPWPAAAAPSAMAAPVLESVAALQRSHGLAAEATSWQRDDSVRWPGSGSPVYVDFPSFRAPGSEELVRDALAGNTRRDLHFGREASTRGGRFLYQTIPLVGAPGRRDVNRRWDRIASLLRDADISVRDRVVLDVGCNAGMMLAASLGDGAAWGVGWDLPEVARRARSLLWRLGCTRFDIVEAELDSGYRISDDLPPHVAASMTSSVILYLAIRHHVGFLAELGELDWQVLVYEGGETESVARLDEALADLAELCEFDVRAAVDFRDGEGASRPLAVLIRR